MKEKRINCKLFLLPYKIINFNALQIFLRKANPLRPKDQAWYCKPETMA